LLARLDAFPGLGGAAAEVDGLAAGRHEGAVVGDPVELRAGPLRGDEPAGPCGAVQVGGHDTLAHALWLPMQRLQQPGVPGALAAIREPRDD
jgi:hypothetical protein